MNRIRRETADLFVIEKILLIPSRFFRRRRGSRLVGVGHGSPLKGVLFGAAVSRMRNESASRGICWSRVDAGGDYLEHGTLPDPEGQLIDDLTKRIEQLEAQIKLLAEDRLAKR